MTELQIRFLESIYNGAKTAEELCAELKIQSNDNDEVGGSYNALNSSINFLKSDDGNEIDDMFDIIPDDSPYSNKDRYVITKAGRVFVENYRSAQNNSKSENMKWLIGIVVAIIGIVITIIIA